MNLIFYLLKSIEFHTEFYWISLFLLVHKTTTTTHIEIQETFPQYKYITAHSTAASTITIVLLLLCLFPFFHAKSRKKRVSGEVNIYYVGHMWRKYVHTDRGRAKLISSEMRFYVS